MGLVNAKSSITVHIYILYTYLFLLLFTENYKHQQSYACIGVDHKVLWKSYVCKDRLYNVWKPRSCSIRSSRKSHFFRESFAYWSLWLKFKGWRLGIGTWCWLFFIGRRQKVLMNTLNFLPCNDHPLVYFDGWRNCQQLRLRTVDVSWSWWASHAIDTVGSWIFPTGGLQQLDHDNSVFCWLVVIPTQETLGFWLVNNYDLATHTSIYISYVYIICIPIFPYLYIYIYLHTSSIPINIHIDTCVSGVYITMTITPLFTGLLPWTDLRVRPLLAWLSHSWCAAGQGIRARFVNLFGVDGGPWYFQMLDGC